MNEWKWKGTNYSFVEIVQWAFVFNKLAKERPKGWSEIMSKPDKVEDQAKIYGMSMEAVAHEITRIGDKLKDPNALYDRTVSIVFEDDENEAHDNKNNFEMEG